ncbi:hypothetical protein [Bradyrhizobium sp.]|uniref:hypothetical protein n=1 Tax=Bradyrhizobium sp. TaxID=376 RepID=UPI0025BB8554|nr:hypothetical protein [Bradyrhizobium sp.]
MQTIWPGHGSRSPRYSSHNSTIPTITITITIIIIIIIATMDIMVAVLLSRPVLTTRPTVIFNGASRLPLGENV